MYYIRRIYYHLQFAAQLLFSNTQRKHIFRWIMSLRPNYLVNKPSPWMTFDAIEYLRSLPLCGAKVFEYGSGGSTLFWLKHGARVVSIEHNSDWYKLLNDRVEKKSHFDYRLVLPEPFVHGKNIDTDDPTLYLSEDTSFEGCTFKNYVHQIDSFPDNHFDIVLIDGRARPSCIMHSAKKIKQGGMLILDDATRHYYTAKAGVYLKHFNCQEYFGARPTQMIMGKTNIYFLLTISNDL